MSPHTETKDYFVASVTLSHTALIRTTPQNFDTYEKEDCPL